jgi:uncharacterized protein involved in exopolysaccharide biosynthesis
MGGLMIIYTADMPKLYRSTASIYTGITTGGGIMEGRSDWMIQSSSYDNLANIITSRETLKEVGLRLLATHMTMKQINPMIISAKHLEEVQKLINVNPDIIKLTGSSDSITYQNLVVIADTHPFLIGVVNYRDVPYYSNTALSSISVNRVQNSDMISLDYFCDDPGVCQQTLEILIDVCIRNYRQLKEGQTDKKVAYYEEQLQLAQEKLKQVELREEEFKKTYGVVDLGTQQGLAISDRQDISNQIVKEQDLQATLQAGLRQIENQMGGQASIKRADIMQKQTRLGQLNIQLVNAQLSGSASRIATIQEQIKTLEADLRNDLAETFSTTATGATASNEYFNRMVALEESKARQRSLESRRNTVTRQFNRMLPLQDSLRRIQREIEISEKEYLAALDNWNMSRREQQDQRSFSTIQVIDRPNYPLSPQSSKRKLLVLLGTMIGLIIPTSVILGMAYFNNNLKTPEHAEETIGLKVAGIMPNKKKLQMLKNHELISDGLSDTILKSLYMAERKTTQTRVLIISTRSEEGKTMISNMLCERLHNKGRKCLLMTPPNDTNSWMAVSYKVDKLFYQAKAEDIVPVERMDEADILIIELPPLIMNDYPVELIREFDMAFLICNANREWGKADQTALNSFTKISGITPQIILNEVDMEIVEEILGKVE